MMQHMNRSTAHKLHLFNSFIRSFLPSSHYALLSFFFFAGLEVIFTFHRFIPFLVAAILLLLIIGIILIRAEEGGRFHPTQVILPTMAALGLIGLALFLPADFTVHIYSLLAACLFFLVLKYGAKQAYPTWNWIISHIVLFACLTTLLGWRFDLYIPLLVVIGFSFLIFFLISLQSLQRLTPSTSEAILLSLSTAFVLTEATWTLQFLPLSFLVQAGFLVALYYVLFHLATISYERPITRQDVVEYMAVGGSALFIILITARWT